MIHVLLISGMIQGYPLDKVAPFNLKYHNNQIEGIDAIVFINLDKRVEKNISCIKQFQNYGLSVGRFKAVDGWSLTQDDLDTILQPIKPGMQLQRWAAKIYPDPKNFQQIVYLDENSLNQPMGSIFLTPGFIGCFMSHLTLAKNAYDQGLNRVWILEDDFKIVKDPHIISELVAKLDTLVGAENWDILHTDLDTKDGPLYFGNNNFFDDLEGVDCAWFWRPDFKPDPKKLKVRKPISSDFIKVGSRMRTHSYILNKSGMQKIVDFYTSHGLFTTNDHELCLIPGINIYSLCYDVVSFEDGVSDTRSPL